MTSEHPGSHVFQQTRTIFIHIQDIMKNAPPTATGTIFELVQYIIGKNLLTKFHDDRTINMASRVLTRKNATPPWRPYIIGTNHLTKFHDDQTINVASRVLTRKIATLPDIIRTNLLTKFHEDWTIHVASRVFTRKNAPPLGSHVFQANVIIYEPTQDIIETNLLTKFHEDWTINVASRVLSRKTALPPGGHFHDDWAKIVTFRVSTAPPPGSHLHEDWASNVTSTHDPVLKLSRGTNGTNVLTKFHEDQTINVASRVFTRQNVDDARWTTDKRRSQKLTMSTLRSGELKRQHP
ncbi:hypothetical protein DPMN_001926 [Dreissena polymorpha]|uniref:Uncharacterized protein n=1 Tax=Dreissena polymorpha TaxID=45954 RepID=A0A9D4MKP4_DREPO|nr:hypothetical protein DPMN_001926 [Dreissena polymorpha]